MSIDVHACRCSSVKVQSKLICLFSNILKKLLVKAVMVLDQLYPESQGGACVFYVGTEQNKEIKYFII